MARKVRSSRIGRVRTHLRGKVWYLCYYENGQRRRPWAGPEKDVARPLAAETNAQREVGAPAPLSFEPLTIVGRRDRWLQHHDSSVATVQRNRRASADLMAFVRRRLIGETRTQGATGVRPVVAYDIACMYDPGQVSRAVRRGTFH